MLTFIVTQELDRARRKLHEARNKLKNCETFIERHDGDPDKATSLAINNQLLPGLRRAIIEAEQELALQEQTHQDAGPVQHVRSFVFRERTTPLTEQELNDYPDLPDYLRR